MEINRCMHPGFEVLNMGEGVILEYAIDCRVDPDPDSQ